MATMTAEQRRIAWVQFMREAVGGEAYSITKNDLRAALDAADAWVDANGASFNTAIPQPARSALTTSQKARLLLFVVRERYLDGV